MKNLIRSLATFTLISAATAAMADGPVGDVAAGELRAAGACVSCHGMDGIGRDESWPNLAGQNAPYLVRQLRSFRDRGRKDAFMSPMARPLTDRDTDDLAAYYSGLPRNLVGERVMEGSPGELIAGRCTSCHGAGGVSPYPIWPSLAGQKERYLAKQIRAFRDGIRIDPLMSPIARQLSDDDINAVAAYYAAYGRQ